MPEGKGTHTSEQEKQPNTRPSWWKRLWARTGFGDKTLWDLLQLLIVPLALAVIGFWFTAQQDQRQQQIENQRAKEAQKIEGQRTEAERKLAEQRAQDEALQTYLDQMGSLLVEKNLRESEEDSEVRTLARARTLTVLGRLDPSRKEAIIQFLDEARLIGREEGREPIIGLSGADLSGANLYGLSGGLINLSGADLSDANLSGANLQHANLIRADLTVADLRDADLSRADLSNAKGVTRKMLTQQAKLLKGTTMPDETLLYATSEFHPVLSFTLSDYWLPKFAFIASLPVSETPAALSIADPGSEFSFTKPLYVFDPSKLSDRKELPAPESAAEWVSWFQKHPNLDTSKPIPVRVGGASGMRIDDVTASSMPENYPQNVCVKEPCIPLYKGSNSESTIVSLAGWKTRIVILDVSGEPVPINIAAPADKFDEFVLKAQELLDSVEWIGENRGTS